MYLNIRQDIPNMYTKTQIILDSSNGNYKLELVNKTINTCEFYRNRKYEPISQVLYKALTKTGTVPTRCPVTKVLISNVFF